MAYMGGNGFGFGFGKPMIGRGLNLSRFGHSVQTHVRQGFGRSASWATAHWADGAPQPKRCPGCWTMGNGAGNSVPLITMAGPIETI
ncbi:uncharacterized protein G2W53_032377 [Senna tora]|uniref:Uncharacterized protein n=1 Tax=Senna tora TaxID=362788 RepID=A0A834WA70_9FABA|nr:uncharacterized protein G2W53_032377 [Senna tora]